MIKFRTNFRPLRAVPIVHEYVKPGFITPIIRAPPLLSLDYNQVTKLIEDKQVQSVELTRQSKHVSILTQKDETLEFDIPENRSLDFINKVTKYDVPVYYKDNPWSANNIMLYAFEFIIISSIFSILYQIFSNRKTATDFGSSQAQENPETNIKFDDVAGLKHAKRDLQEIVDFLKKPERFSKLGAKVPKGALLVGPPGTGKTLLAKAVAGEAGVPFFSCSASEMIQMFVGVGAARIRSLFEKANKKSPSIIFIDEIDAIGRARGGPSMISNDERDQTINQLLTEMDGFKTNSGVIVIAATNRADILDPALLRPGRFDRQIQVDLPDFKDRLDILQVHTRNKPLNKDVDLNDIAKITTGYSGAELSNICNEAAIIAGRHDKDDISIDDFHQAIDKITIGERRDIIVSDEKKRITAYHEAGHALIALKTGLYDTIRTVSIMPRGKTGGVTIFQPKDSDVDSGLYTREYLENQIAVALGGRIAEEIVFGNNKITTGAAQDINVVQNIARHMITHYGLSPKLGAIAWHSEQLSNETQAEIENEIKSIVNKIHNQTKSMMIKYRDVLDAIADALIVQEKLSGQELNDLISAINH